MDLFGNLRYFPYAGGSLDEVALHFHCFLTNHMKCSIIKCVQQAALEIWKKSTEKTSTPITNLRRKRLLLLTYVLLFLEDVKM